MSKHPLARQGSGHGIMICCRLHLRKKSLTKILHCNILNPLHTFICIPFPYPCITFSKTMLFCIQAVFSHFVSLFLMIFLYICNCKIVKIDLPTYKNTTIKKNEYRNNQGTIVIHCKRWLL